MLWPPAVAPGAPRRSSGSDHRINLFIKLSIIWVLVFCLVPFLFVLRLFGMGNPVSSNATANIAVEVMRGKLKPYRDDNARTPSGFNFDDDSFGRRSDFRSHLDDLASRHPEFADHLLWDDIPFRGSLRNRRRESGSGNNYQDEDAKSQASGSSAASGASAVSSHGEPEIRQEFQEPRRKPIPKYGLRNTVDIGQHRMDMENPEKVNRNQRSMSAPPENRQPQQQEPQQRFVSRVEITPQQKQQQQQQQQQQQEQSQREKSPGPQPQPQQTPQQKAQQQGNVRHIPIFVEGRDEPVIPRNVDDVPFPGQSPPPPQFQTPPQYQQPPQYQTPPQFQPPPPTFQPPPTFHRPSHFNERFGRQNWPSQFQEAFFDQPRWSRDGPERPERLFKKDWTHGQQPHPQEKHPQYQQEKPQYQQEKHPQYQQEKHPPYQQEKHPQYQQEKHPQYQQEKQQPQQPQQKQEPEIPKPKPTLPKDPLERVAIVQKEVDSLTEQVKNHKGTSRNDKEYIYLDEMLTRELIKLDDIETEGKENVRQARKNAIKSIQDSINLLESMVPLPGQQQPQSQESENQPEEAQSPETMETEVPQEAHNDIPIPLPPGPCCLVPKEENSNTPMEQNQESGQLLPETGKPEAQVESEAQETQKAEAEAATEKAEEATKVEEASQTVDNNTEPKSPVMMEVQGAEKSENQDQVDGPQEGQVPKAAKSPKKVKKTKKQPVPVSEEAIPLPPPKSNQKGTK